MDYQLLFDQYQPAHTGVKLSRQRRLYGCLREAILNGHLPAGAKLPGTRALAVELGIARNTALYAYEQLVTEGLLQTQGGGTRVATGMCVGNYWLALFMRIAQVVMVQRLN